ncbi:MAG: ATP-dependent RNA helicase HrpA, partial [Proteobacteria bacterium]|nr:ATP-dependent RNA helicase HrpA [Pseudomonadota bacterium]
PGIRYVVDSGLARIKRYSLRNKTTLLQIEKISQASAAQRAGRSGRVQDGVAVRLYDADDYAARPAFTEPEILRSSLASVILRAAALELGPVDAFPFVDAPSPRAIADGYQLLQDLGAVDGARKLTALGRELARLPLDPRIGRILWDARANGTLAEALVIASALAVPDPRERPLDKRAAADQAHLVFRDDRSDFLSLVALWEFFAKLRADGLSHRRQVDACRAQFVSHLRLVEWRDVHQQLAAQLDEAGWKWTRDLPQAFDAPRYEALHRALLAGLLSNIGQRQDDGDGYTGARGTQFVLHPSSGLAKARPRWVLAAELTETTRLFARCAARVEPEWIEAVAGDRVERSYFDPRWDARRGDVVGAERVQLYGLTLVARRPVSYGRIDAAAAHDVFIREALVGGDERLGGPYAEHNRALLAEIATLEHKARRADVLVDDDTIAAFYAQRVPAHVHSRAGFEAWRRDAERTQPKLLWMTRDDLMRHAASAITEELYPATVAMGGVDFPLAYRHAPGHPLDGLTLTVPLALLNQVDAARLSWLVPGMIREKVTALMKGLPKALRNRLMPLPDQVTAFLATEPARDTDVADALRAWLRTRYGEVPERAVLDAIELPPHLRANVSVVDASGDELGSGRDLAALRRDLGEAAQMSFATDGDAFERHGAKRWDFGTLPAALTVQRGGARVTGYPALVDEGASVALAVMDTEAAAAAATRAGVVRLVAIALADAVARYAKGPPQFNTLALALRSVIAPDALLQDVMGAVADRAFVGDDPLPRDEAAFNELQKRARTRLPAVADGAFRLLAEIAAAWTALTQRLNGAGPSLGRVVADVRAQRDALVYPGFFGRTPWPQLRELPRYLTALDRRLAKYPERAARDAQHGAELAALWQRYRERLDADRRAGRHDPRLEEWRWLLEELKVSLFAQELKTPFPVSFKRLEKAWQAIRMG